MSLLNALRLWHDFFVGTGVASAVLLGFAFLGLAQRRDHMNGNSELHALEGQTLGSLFSILIVCLLILIPAQTPRSLGFPLLAASVLAFISMARNLLRWARGRLKGVGAAFLFWRVAAPAAVLLAATIASIMLIAEARNSGMESLYLLSAAFLALLLIAARNTWTLLGHSGQERLRLHRGSKG